MAPKKANSIPVVPWKKSQEKAMLKKNILDGVVRVEMNPEEVYQMYDGYKKYKYVNFKRNLQCLHNTINRKKQQMIVGNVAFERFKKSASSSRLGSGLHLPNTSTSWYNSAAKTLLASDIHAGHHLGKGPKEIWQSRKEYQEFNLDKFRNHYYTLSKKMAKENTKAQKKEEHVEQE